MLEKPLPALPPDAATNQDPRGRLTAAQLSCLRLARTKVSNKNIARALGISQHTVIQHLRAARMRLGDIERAAAIELIDHWDRTHPHDVISRAQTIVHQPSSAMVGTPSAAAGAPVEELTIGVHEDRVSFDLQASQRSPSLRRLVVQWLRSFSAGLTPAQRSRKIIGLMLVLGIGVLVMAAVGESIQRTLHGLGY